MKKSELKNTIKEEIQKLLKEEMDYSSRNQSFLNLSDEMVSLQKELEGLDFPTLFQNKFEEAGKNYRLGPLAADTQSAISKIRMLLAFLHRTEQ